MPMIQKRLVRTPSERGSATRAWEMEFEKAEAGVVFVRADSGFAFDPNPARRSFGPSGVTYERLGVSVEAPSSVAHESQRVNAYSSAKSVRLGRFGAIKR